jgi:hypothetical protein
MALTARGATPTSVFRLLGADESAVFRDLLIAAIFKRQVDARDAVITLQTHAADGGFTDLELQAGLRFHVIVEAKRSWELPTMRQLSCYQPRLVTAGAALQRLVSVSAMTADHAVICRETSVALNLRTCLGGIYSVQQRSRILW